MFEKIAEKLVEKTEEWIWVEGYKGTDKDMKCRDYQYELGKPYDMPKDEKIEACESGFHLCLKLNDVFGYYSIGDGNRYFKVKALVRKSDFEEYGEYPDSGYVTMYGMQMRNPFCSRIDKLAAKSIEFVEELTPDEILKGYITDEWTDEDKQDAIQHGTNYVRKKHEAAELEKKKQALIDLGYSIPFASWLMANDKYDKAFAVGSQPDLSMDMKVLAIMKLK